MSVSVRSVGVGGHNQQNSNQCHVIPTHLPPLSSDRRGQRPFGGHWSVSRCTQLIMEPTNSKLKSPGEGLCTRESISHLQNLSDYKGSDYGVGCTWVGMMHSYCTIPRYSFAMTALYNDC
mmetsp:Transcript_115342/g.200826  ORF Transcript_115342/g.200826 Transcript_115342/m.200826 type:complete len:120 (-) Transcript_115342:244-603(-)